MDIEERIKRRDPEDIRLEYKDKAADNSKLDRELTAMANSEGGVLILGVRENDDGEPDQIHDVPNPHDRVLGVANAIDARTEPSLEFNSDTHQVEGKTVLTLQLSTPTCYIAFGI